MTRYSPATRERVKAAALALGAAATGRSVARALGVSVAVADAALADLRRSRELPRGRHGKAPRILPPLDDAGRERAAGLLRLAHYRLGVARVPARLLDEARSAAYLACVEAAALGGTDSYAGTRIAGAIRSACRPWKLDGRPVGGLSPAVEESGRCTFLA